MPISLAPPLYPWQTAAMGWLRGRSGGAPLFLDMRLGKTRIAIRRARELGAKRVLIISPYSVMEEWERQLLEEGCKSIALLSGNKIKRIKKLQEEKIWTISNFEMAEKLSLHEIHWDAKIVDESIKIANPKAKVTKYLTTAFSPSKFDTVLCGNPAPESEMQLFCQFKFCFGNFMGYKNFWGWRNKYYINLGYDWAPMPGVLGDINRWANNNSFRLTRKDAGLNIDKIYVIRKVEANVEQKEQYNSVLDDFYFQDLDVKNTLAQLTYLCRISGGYSCIPPHEMISENKIKEIIYLLTTELKNKSVLIWVKFKKELEVLQKKLTEIGLSVVAATGESVNKEMIRRRFMEGKALIAILTIAAFAKGKDWSRADIAIYYSNEYSNDLRSQSEDRIISARKNHGVLIIDLITKGTKDEEIINLLKNKQFNAKQFMKQL